MKTILALVILAATFAIPMVVGAPDVFGSPAVFTSFGANYVSENTVLTLTGGVGAGEPITFGALTGPGNSEAQKFRKALNDLPIMEDNDLRINGLSPLAHLLHPEFDPLAPIDIAGILHDISGPPGQQ
jgi:hypothetical protein